LATMLSDVNSYSQKLLRKQKSKEVSAWQKKTSMNTLG
jgi:hypothetical protein